MRKPVLILTALLFFSTYLFAQNSMTGDGFGGRGWYKAHNYQAGAYSAYTVCGDSNQLYGWGGNNSGELGNGTTISSVLPVAAIGMTRVKFYTTGYVSGVIKNDSTAWVWGYPSHGFTAMPAQKLTNVKFLDGGISHIVFVKNDSTVWAAGNNYDGELGIGQGHLFDPVTVPVRMVGIANAVRAIAVYNTSIILLSDGTVKITGGDDNYQTPNTTVPVALPGLSNIVDIKGHSRAAFALDTSGNVFAFGKGAAFLGLGAVDNNLVIPPTQMSFPAGAAPIVALSANCDGYSALALDSNHKVYGWGNNHYSELGTGDSSIKMSPVLIDSNVIDIFAGETFCYILKKDSSLWASGASAFNGSIWMNLPNIKRKVFTQIDPTIAPMNLCAPKVWGVVPVKLSNFICFANGNNAILNWQSAEETNASKYIVEYSNDGRNFQSIATLIAKGSNSKYNYIHFNVSGTAFYRLKMMDKDGSFTYSEIRVVRFNGKAGVTIAPNPANDFISVFTKSNTPVKTIQLISIDGRILKGINNYNSGQQINIAKFTSGTYVLKVIYSNADVEYVRFIKN